MFLPTKPHQSLIAKDQYSIRLGNRVPKDAVNLAYTHLPPVLPKENIQITDLSSTILENSRNATIVDQLAVPDDSLLLTTDTQEVQLPTEDMLMTNIFSGDIPLYYAHTLSYYHYDRKGPDQYGMYQGDGISIVDQQGRPVLRPYRIQLVPKEEGSNIYKVVLYTSFKDVESDTYQVVYNAIDLMPEGTMITTAGYKERLSLRKAFERTYDLRNILDMSDSDVAYPKYYQANGSSPGYSRFFVPTPSVEDKRHKEYFRYQVILEVTIGKETKIFTTPWFSSDVMNVKDLTDDEAKEYANGSKKITQKTTSEILSEYVNLQPYSAKEIVKKFIVRADNDKVQLFTRIDGSSNILASTTSTVETDMKMPIKARKTLVPQYSDASLTFSVRPIYARPTDTQYISFVVDHSKSMVRNDPSRKTRYQIIADLIDSAKDFYKNVKLSGHTFNFTTTSFQESFTSDSSSFLMAYDRTSSDKDTTDIETAIQTARSRLGTITNSSSNNKSLILITDGEFDDEKERQAFKTRILQAANSGIYVGIVTFNNYTQIRDMFSTATRINVLNALSPRLGAALRYYFFELSGKQDSVKLAFSTSFGMSPEDNNKFICRIDNTLNLPLAVQKDINRFGIDVSLSSHPMVNIFMRDHLNKPMLTVNGANIIPLVDLFLGNQFVDIIGHSEYYQWKFSPVYSIRYNDTQQVQVLEPREQSATESWYLRIKNGRFQQIKLDEKGMPVVYSYGVPEYYRQDFEEEKGRPYIKIRGEKPKILSDTQIRVSRTPLYVEYELAQAMNAVVWVNGKKVKIKSTRAFDGIFELEFPITRNDEIYVDYEYEENYYVYRGYYNEETKEYWSLDLNPSVGHYVTLRDTNSDEVQYSQGFSLINKTIYIYMKPVAQLVSTDMGDYRNEGDIAAHTLFHTFEKIDYDPNIILLAEVRVRPNSNQGSLQVVDSRVRGGGLKPEITEAIMQEFEQESFFYWDIGYWDGKPYSENAVVTFRISRSILKEYGGRFTKADVEERVNKHLGYGIFPIIEFTQDSDYLLEIPRNLHAEVFNVEDDGDISIERPTFELSKEG